MSTTTRRTSHRQRGFGLVELTVGLAISAAIGSILVSLLFQMNRTVKDDSARFDVAANVTVASRWIARDVRRADSTSIVDGASPTPTAMINYNNAGGAISCLYSLTGGELERSCDDGTLVIARGVSGLQFSRTGSVVTIAFDVTSDTEPALVETVALRIGLRNG